MVTHKKSPLDTALVHGFANLVPEYRMRADSRGPFIRGRAEYGRVALSAVFAGETWNATSSSFSAHQIIREIDNGYLYFSDGAV